MFNVYIHLPALICLKHALLPFSMIEAVSFLNYPVQIINLRKNIKCKREQIILKIEMKLLKNLNLLCCILLKNKVKAVSRQKQF
jgi:hypothetical protein